MLKGLTARVFPQSARMTHHSSESTSTWYQIPPLFSSALGCCHRQEFMADPLQVCSRVYLINSCCQEPGVFQDHNTSWGFFEAPGACKCLFLFIIKCLLALFLYPVPPALQVRGICCSRSLLTKGKIRLHPGQVVGPLRCIHSQINVPKLQ